MGVKRFRAGGARWITGDGDVEFSWCGRPVENIFLRLLMLVWIVSWLVVVFVLVVVTIPIWLPLHFVLRAVGARGFIYEPAYREFEVSFGPNAFRRR